MIWFEYKYLTSSEILNNIKNIMDFSIIDYTTFILLSILIILSILYFIPILKISIEERKKAKEKRIKKELLRKIALQKDIEESIAKELNIK